MFDGHKWIRTGSTLAVASAFSLLLVAQTLWAQEKKTPALAQLIKGAKKETTLRGMWSSRSLGGSKGFSHIVAAMNKKYGLNIKPEFTPGPSMTRMIGKLTRELKAGQPASTDVYWGNSGGMLRSSKVGLMRSMNWLAYLSRPMLKEKGFNPVAPKGMGLASASTLVGVMYNSDRVKGKDIPRTLADTLKPKWKGKIASTPYAAGMREFAMPDLLGKEAMIEFTKKLSKQISGLIRCGDDQKILSGEFLMLVLTCGDQYVNQAKRTGTPLGYSVLSDATVSHTRYGGVPKNSQAPNAAALFVVYLHSPEGQKWMWEVNGFDFHLYPKSHVRTVLDGARRKGAKVVINSPQWLGKNKTYRKTRKELQKILRRKAK
ncbi:MAG: ABC transporter substrate-binding protein [Candidatus Binatia bacterium]